MDGRRDRIFWVILAAGLGLAALLLVTHRSTGFRTSTPGAPSCDRAEIRGGALIPPARTPAATAGPSVDGIARADRRAGALASRDGERARHEADSLLAFVRDPAIRAAVCRALPPDVVDARLVARLVTETDPAAIPAAVALLARISGADAEDALVRLVGRAGSGGFPDVVEEVLARDDGPTAPALVLLAGCGLDVSMASERGRVLERLEDAPRLPDGIRGWASREPDPDLRERLGFLLSAIDRK